MLEKYNTSKEHESEILNLMEEEDDFEQEEDLQTSFAIYFKRLSFQINKCLQKNSTQPESISIAASSQRQIYIRLPKLSIEPFDGYPQHFLKFWDSFCYSVHENESIQNVKKMTQPKGLLKGDAALCISGFKITDENYKTSVNLLRERYNNKQLNVSSHMTNLLNLHQLISSDNVHDLWKIYDIVET